MARVRKASSTDEPMSSAQTPKDQEDVMINLAMKQAEEQLREGKAPAQVVVHFLKLGSTRERLEQEDLEQKVRLEQAKTESLQSQKRIEDLYSNALKAMRNYSGQDEAQDDEDV